MTWHADPTQLAGYSRGDLDPARAASVEAHLLRCDRCRSALAARTPDAETDRAWAEQPASRTRHLVTNVLVEASSAIDEYAVRSAFLVSRTHGDKPYDLFSGERRDVLRRDDDGLRIARREILLDETVLHSYNLSIFF